MRRSRHFPQARGRATYEKLLAASRAVFARKGFDEAQSTDIAAEAGASVGTFYRYFDDKRQAFVEMIAHHLEEAHAEVMEKLTPQRFAGVADRRGAIDVALDVLFAHVRRFPELEGVYLAMSLRDPEVAELRAQYEALGCDELARLVELLIPREVVPDPRAAAFVIHYAVVEAAMALAVRRTPFPVAEAAVKAALGDLLYRYLFAPSEAAATAAPSGRSGSASARYRSGAGGRSSPSATRSAPSSARSSRGAARGRTSR